METALDILQVVVNVSAGATAVTVLLGRLLPDEKVRSFFFTLGSKLSQWGSKTFTLATWNAVEKHIIHVFDVITSSFGAGLRSDNEE